MTARFRVLVTGTSIKCGGVKLFFGLSIFYSHLYLNEIEQQAAHVPIQTLSILHVQGIHSVISI